jgi:Terminase large subunit, T4likevirus-type, N-terminal
MTSDLRSMLEEAGRRGMRIDPEEFKPKKRLLDIFPPQPGPQEQYMTSTADITLYGGSAGGGKTFATLLKAAEPTYNANFGAMIFRRTLKQVKEEQSIWDESVKLYPNVGARQNVSGSFWTFPSGASIQFAGIEHEGDQYDYQGSQLCYIFFEELTHFTERQFWYLLSRNRSTCGVKPQMFATMNPEPGWVKRLAAPWVDRKFPTPAKSGETRWFVRERNKLIWLPGKPEREACTNGPDGKGCLKEGCENCFPPEKSITFIRASVYDNRALLERDPGYIGRLMNLDEVEKQRLLHGDWDARPEHIVLDRFDESVHVVPPREIPWHWRISLGGDFGDPNFAAVAVAEETILEETTDKQGRTQQVVVSTGRWFLIDEYWPGHSVPWPELGKKLRSMCKNRIHRSSGGNRTTEQGWRQALRKESIPMGEPTPGHTDPGLQYKCVNDAFAADKLFIFDTCTETIAMILDFMRDLGDDGEPTEKFDDGRFHLLAALRYIGVTLWPPAAPIVGGKSETVIQGDLLVAASTDVFGATNAIQSMLAGQIREQRPSTSGQLFDVFG